MCEQYPEVIGKHLAPFSCYSSVHPGTQIEFLGTCLAGPIFFVEQRHRSNGSEGRV